mgnify:CR=1 FL=1
MGIIAKQGIKGTIVTYIGVAIGFVTTFFVITRFLTAEEIGLARVLIDAATLFIGLAQLGTSSSIIRFFPYFTGASPESTAVQPNREPPYHGFFAWTVYVPLLGFGIVALIYGACATPLQAWFGEKSPLFNEYYYAVLPLAFFMLYQTVFETNANALMHIVLPRAVREIGVRLGMLATYVLYALGVLSMDGYVLCICLTYAVAALINLAYVIYLGGATLRPDWAFLRANKPLLRDYGLYTGFLIISALTGILGPTLSTFFITAKMGLDYTGIFAIATYIAVMVSIPYRSVTAISQPELAQAIKDDNKADIKRLLRQVSSNLLLIGGFIFLAIWMNIDLIFAILPNGATYAIAKKTVFLLCLSQLILATFAIFTPAISYSKWYIFNLLCSLILTISALLLNNYLIPRYGMDGAAAATLISNTIFYGLIAIIGCAVLKVFPFSRSHALSIVLLVAIGLADALLQRYIPWPNLWLSSIVRTIVLLGGGLWTAYRLHLSTEIDALLHSIRLPRH